MNLDFSDEQKFLKEEAKKFHGQRQEDSGLSKLKLPKSNHLYFCTLF